MGWNAATGRPGRPIVGSKLAQLSYIPTLQREYWRRALKALNRANAVYCTDYIQLCNRLGPDLISLILEAHYIE